MSVLPRVVIIYKRDSRIMYLLVYVDDLILTGNHSPTIKSFVTTLDKEFAIKDLGRLNYFLGLEVTYTQNGLFLNQSKYTMDILTRANMLDAKPAPTPLSSNVSFVSAGTVAFGLHYSRPITTSLLSYSDADWDRCLETRRSTYGYSIFLGGNLISWSAKKQLTVARSSCESEYRAMANTAAEIVWITHLLQELHALPSDRPTLLCDNQSAIFLT
ncbi:uncharacterized mitochondrial protein AtMg00810-like [Helianthus annuus]|uniref:uncharacterized mitochondrial protein AtMg00810-like n=1 Tax=Helianthus annuus TaxID=4232 RepID=UPI000B8F862A|nr:uncharacterized mitochondrial protein AtMg00810-like [Helianthus annuus]